MMPVLPAIMAACECGGVGGGLMRALGCDAQCDAPLAAMPTLPRPQPSLQR